MLGILLIDKRTGCTSHDVVAELRRRLGTKRVGHSGTLDPLASGLLVVAVGPATRFLQYLPLEPKEYVAQVRFGAETETYDAEGDLRNERPVPDDLEARINEALPNFLGLISQTPPLYSAIKVQGKPLYRYAREGIEPRREPRTVRIDVFEPVGPIAQETTFRIVCSGGTYIRTLAHDLGQTVGCGAYLSGLRRTQVGKFDLSAAIPQSEANAQHLVPLREALPPMPLIEANAVQASSVREGRAIGLAEPPNAPFAALVDGSGEVFSIVRVHGNVLQPECVIPLEAIHGAH